MPDTSTKGHGAGHTVIIIVCVALAVMLAGTLVAWFTGALRKPLGRGPIWDIDSDPRVQKELLKLMPPGTRVAKGPLKLTPKDVVGGTGQTLWNRWMRGTGKCKPSITTSGEIVFDPASCTCTQGTCASECKSSCASAPMCLSGSGEYDQACVATCQGICDNTQPPYQHNAQCYLYETTSSEVYDAFEACMGNTSSKYVQNAGANVHGFCINAAMAYVGQDWSGMPADAAADVFPSAPPRAANPCPSS